MVEIIPKPPQKRSLGQETLFYSAIILLVLVVGAYFALGHFKKEEQKTIQGLNDQISAVKTKEMIELKDNLLAKEKKINDFSNLLNNHWQVASLFPFLGEICHPQVQFLSLNFQADKESFQVGIPAKAESFQVLHQQLLILGEEDSIKKIEVSGISLGKDGAIDFNLILVLSPELFKFE